MQSTSAHYDVNTDPQLVQAQHILTLTNPLLIPASSNNDNAVQCRAGMWTMSGLSLGLECLVVGTETKTMSSPKLAQVYT